MVSETPLVHITNLSMVFGGLSALSDIDYEIDEGLIQGIIGPNGAGKTTLFNIMTGLYQPTSGEVFYQGTPLTGLLPHQVADLGITRTFQNVRLFDDMTALENVMLGRHRLTRAGFIAAAFNTRRAQREEVQIRTDSYSLLEVVGLEERASVNAGDLPLGWQRRLELARALATEPALLLLDEPAAGLNTAESRELANVIQRIRDRGVTIVLVEHDMDVVMRVADMVLVLDYGRILASGTPSEIQNNPEVIRAYLGDE